MTQKERIAELEEQLAKAKWQNDLTSRAWQLPDAFEPSELTAHLPVPRIEMRFEKTGKDWYDHKWTYGLVIRPYAWLHESGKPLCFVPLSHTTGRGGADPTRYDRLPTPFRDGVNIQADMYALRLPGFIVCEELNKVERLEVDLAEFEERFKAVKQ
ncbi:MAG TPA: hypothetical protein VN038_01360 [Dyadobacter sp.]|nr:hypothetical protein [Dyadobacter sp.]